MTAAAMKVLLVPSLRLEGWKAMDRYADALARELPQIAPRGSIISVARNLRAPSGLRFPARWLVYPRLVRWSGWDIVHVLDHSYAHLLHRRRGPARTVLTIHDLFALDPLSKKPGLRGWLLGQANRWVLSGAQNADLCLCDSTTTCEDVVRHFPEVAPRVKHAPLGVGDEFFVADLPASRHAGRAFLGTPPEAVLVLHVGSCLPRKGIESLLHAVARLARRIPDIHLVQAGGPLLDGQRQLMARLNLEGRVTEIQHVPEANLPDVYAAADVVAEPSLFEGFGLPVLEAFAVGTPVVATRNTSLRDFPEALLQSAGTGTPGEIASALERAIVDRSAARARAQAAREWASAHRWRDVARQTWDAYSALR
jgi:glycosyltransferase involved in cell wall biosynthesis